MPKTHGHFGKPTYNSWASMKARCLNPKSDRYPYYGGRGITVCERWYVFEHFLADMGVRPEGTTLERIDNTKGYEPGNCTWATKQEQANNRRSNTHLTINGTRYTIAQAARAFGVSEDAISQRLLRGVPAEEAVQ